MGVLASQPASQPSSSPSLLASPLPWQLSLQRPSLPFPFCQNSAVKLWQIGPIQEDENSCWEGIFLSDLNVEKMHESAKHIGVVLSSLSQFFGEFISEKQYKIIAEQGGLAAYSDQFQTRDGKLLSQFFEWNQF